MSESTVDLLVQHACFAADRVALNLYQANITPAELTRREIKAALELLIGNGLITIVDPAAWPEYVVLDPPYNLDDAFGATDA